MTCFFTGDLLCLQVDIDDILKRAETHHTQDTSNEADELLSQFKVVSIDNLEDEELEKYDPGKLISVNTYPNIPMTNKCTAC